jgi:autotransporter-associated beta strand protein
MGARASRRARRSRFASVIVCTLGGLSTNQSFGADLYWDSDGATPGGSAGSTASGTWGTSAFWGGSADGDTGTGAWTDGSTAVFSAGNDVTGTYSVTIASGTTQTAGGLVIEDGSVTLSRLSGSVVALGANSVTINSGATLAYGLSTTFSHTPGASIFLNGGTLRSTNTSAINTFYSSAANIHLGAVQAGTVYATALGGSLYSGQILGDGGVTTLVKDGPGDFRSNTASGGNTFTKLVVNQGIFRPGATAPANTTETPGNPGFFGQVPSSLLADNITLQNGALIGNFNGFTLHENRGIVLGSGGGGLDASDGTMTVPGPISGAGDFVIAVNDTTQTPAPGTTQVLSGTNTYGGSTLINQGSLAVHNGAAIPDGSAVVISTTNPAAGDFNVNSSQTI